jgi:hypothetical protein
LGRVGQAAALKLLHKKAAEEGVQPFFQHCTAVFSSECILGQVKNLRGSGSETKEMIRKKSCNS